MNSDSKKIRRIIRLDGMSMMDRAQTHRYLKKKFHFPAYYGNNLDALHDLLTEIGMPVKVILNQYQAILETQGEYGQAIISVFRDADTQNPNLEFFIED